MRASRPIAVITGVLTLGALALPAHGIDRPFSTSRLAVRPVVDPLAGGGQTTGGTGQFSKVQIERYRCTVAAGAAYGTPTAAMDISCNDPEPYGQNFNPDNELAVAVDPKHPGHVLAGSNDYFYRFNNSTGARQALVPTGFMTSFDGGATWVDGQIPLRSGNGAGDPSPAFVGKFSSNADPHASVALMAQLENTGGQGGPFVAQGDVAVSRSTDGGITWSEPITVMKGQGAGIGPSNQGVFWDKEWLTVDNYPASPHYGRAYLVATRFLNGLHGSYAESPIYLSYSDDGGRTWTQARKISGSLAACDFQSLGGGSDCDESQFGIPEVAPNGDVYVHFVNGNIDDQWEEGDQLESTILVIKSIDGGDSFGSPARVVTMEDGTKDTPYSVIGRQTVTGHQIRWTATGNIAADPTNAAHVVVVYADNFAGNHDAGAPDCADQRPTAPDYNPCGIETNTNVYMAESWDGGATWTERIVLDGAAGDQWFAWSDFGPDGSLHVAYDSNEGSGGDANLNDTFNHVLLTVAPRTASSGAAVIASREVLVPNGAGRTGWENPDVSVTHWSGQYVPQTAWPTICGPDGYSDDGIPDAEGKDCNVFDGDYTGLAVGSDGSVNVVWTGLNRFVTSPQIDPYTGAPHDGYAQDAMYARR